ncbi:MULTISPECIES: bifunctional lytic transglycosylase/C40 family peptidase [unclassified Streptomyces]|uniref:C40 family peptidase n=1 Tax=unclassified Streptomyces TaxID=2593676 RepID=UPI002365CCB1|nr:MULTISPECIES: bifunctional lytic transglycosylase/C40 family peptidase [unclassified Streptomyces]MDF3141056.1 bifunctional lytic transglycosylase/C40 family peptidase [Streptomyces sp. T21Q-yed]WDF45041.1 bifunctional lytic transglycosylase/C40 family peptidase [Streptomyces sp. T12]
MKKLGCATVILALLCTPVLLVVFAAAREKDTPAMETVGKVSGIPQRMLMAYQSAAGQLPGEVPKCKGMTWAILAGIAKIESNHAGGRTVKDNGDITPHILGPVLDGSGVGGNRTAFRDTDGGKWDDTSTSERAVGPFQFLPSTWEGTGRDGNSDGTKNPHNADDAALGAAVYLCGKGRNLTDRSQLKAAILQYNHSQAYVTDVLSWIDRYSQLGDGTIQIGANATGNARAVINAALSEVGEKYSWGGGGANGPTTGICCSPGGSDGTNIKGYDCSGLTTYAYAQVGISLPRTAAQQAGVGKRIPASRGVGALEPGDLVFFAGNTSSDSTIYHVGIYLGDGQMVNAPRPGTKVRTEAVWDNNYAGGARLL